MAIVETHEPINIHDYADFTTCESYGMVAGCDAYCPVLWNGDCPEVIEVLKNVEFSCEGYLELIELYLTPEQRASFFNYLEQVVEEAPETTEPEFKTIW